MKSLRTGWTRADKRAGYKSYNENTRDSTGPRSEGFEKGSGNKTGGGGENTKSYQENEGAKSGEENVQEK